MDSFDAVASTYDADFTNTFIGKIQRRRVWQYLSAQISPGSKIVELNGGTGADALFLTNQGFDVLFTEGSLEMMQVARTKIGHAAKYKLLNLEELENVDLGAKFDLVFSNFGGLNCISKSGLTGLNTFARNHLTEDGQLILVIMPTQNLFDQWYRRWKKIPKPMRNSEVPIRIKVGKEFVETYFHDPADVGNKMSDFRMVGKQPIGFIPSFFASFLADRPLLRVLLVRADRFLAFFPGLSRRADHYLIHLEHK